MSEPTPASDPSVTFSCQRGHMFLYSKFMAAGQVCPVCKAEAAPANEPKPLSLAEEIAEIKAEAGRINDRIGCCDGIAVAGLVDRLCAVLERWLVMEQAEEQAKSRRGREFL